MNIIGTLMDVVVALLLIGVLRQSILMMKRLKAVEASKGEMQDLITALNDSTAKADAVLRGLMNALSGAHREAGRSIEAANSMRDELTVLTEIGETIADRIAKAASAAPKKAASAAPNKATSATPNKAASAAPKKATPAAPKKAASAAPKPANRRKRQADAGTPAKEAANA